MQGVCHWEQLQYGVDVRLVVPLRIYHGVCHVMEGLICLRKCAALYNLLLQGFEEFLGICLLCSHVFPS
mgnify:CR=1 FL=1|jgi:hypothetical protein